MRKNVQCNKDYVYSEVDTCLFAQVSKELTLGNINLCEHSPYVLLAPMVAHGFVCTPGLQILGAILQQIQLLLN